MKTVKITEFNPDPQNANKGTLRGMSALRKSLEQYGAGRSILVDANGVIIAGNKTLEQAADLGLDDVIVIETDGTKLVAVQRMDLDLATDPTARQLAYADNRVGELDLDWDGEKLLADMQAGLDLSMLWDDKEMSDLLQKLGDEMLGEEPADDFGTPQESDFWPFLKVQVSPEMLELWEELQAIIPAESDTDKMHWMLKTTYANLHK